VIAFPGEDIEARAPLLTDLAPRTCEAVWAALPVRGQARHGIYSGSEVYLILPELMRLPPENGHHPRRPRRCRLRLVRGRLLLRRP